MHHVDETRQRRQLDFDFFGRGQHVLVKPQHGMHGGLLPGAASLAGRRRRAKTKPGAGPGFESGLRSRRNYEASAFGSRVNIRRTFGSGSRPTMRPLTMTV